MDEIHRIPIQLGEGPDDGEPPEGETGRGEDGRMTLFPDRSEDEVRAVQLACKEMLHPLPHTLFLFFGSPGRWEATDPGTFTPRNLKV
jgi:hypothetical protein